MVLESDTILVTGGANSLKDLCYFRPEAAAGEELLQPNGSLIIDRKFHASGLLADGKVIIVGGSDTPSPTSDIFNPSTETVAAGPDMAQTRFAPSGTSLDGKFYVCGHYNHVDTSNPVGKQCEVYDPALNNWQPIASPQFNHDATSLGKQAVEQNY